MRIRGRNLNLSLGLGLGDRIEVKDGETVRVCVYGCVDVWVHTALLYSCVGSRTLLYSYIFSHLSAFLLSLYLYLISHSIHTYSLTPPAPFYHPLTHHPMPPRKRPHPAPAPNRYDYDYDNNRPFDAFDEDESDEDDYAMSQPAAKKARTGKGKGKEKAGASKAASKAASGKAGDGGESLPFLSLLRLAVFGRSAGW